MKVVESKMDCKIVQDGREGDSVIHLIELQYSGDVTFWNGVLQLPSGILNKGWVITDGLDLVLEDGRKTHMYISNFSIRQGYMEMAGSLIVAK